MRVALLMLLIAGCWTASEPQPRVSSATDDELAHRDPFPLHSRWSGTYRCSQGLTAMKLALDAQPDGKLDAVFEFAPTADNPGAASGSYRLRGTIRAGKEGTFEIALDPVEWIQEPDGYVMTPLQATSSRKWQRLVGRIVHPSCGELDVRRAD